MWIKNRPWFFKRHILNTLPFERKRAQNKKIISNDNQEDGSIEHSEKRQSDNIQKKIIYGSFPLKLQTIQQAEVIRACCITQKRASFGSEDYVFE